MFSREVYTREFVSLAFANLCFWLSVYLFLPVLPIYYHSLGMNDHEIGLAIGAFSLGAVLFRFIAGRAVDRYGGRRVIMVGIGVSILAVMGYFYSVTLSAVVVTRFFHGVGISGYSAAALTMVTLMHEERNTTEAVAIYTLFTMVGIGIASSSANWLFNWGGMAVIIGVGIAATALSFLLFPVKIKLKIKPAPEDAQPFKTVVSNPGVYIPTINLAAVNFSYSIIMTFLPLYLLNIGVKEFNSFYVGYAVTVVFSRFWVGRLCARFAPERLALYIMLILALTLFVATTPGSSLAIALCGIGAGAGYGLAFPVMATTVTACTQPANRGTAFGFYTTAIDLGFATGAITMGSVASVWGYRAVFLAAGMAALVYSVLYKLLLQGKLSRNAV